MNPIKKFIPETIKKNLFRLFDNIQSINVNAHPGIGDRFGKPFKQYFVSENMPEKLSLLSKGLDCGSQEVVNQKIEHLLQLPAWGTKYQQNMRCLDREKILYTEQQLSEQKRFERALPAIKNELTLKTYIPEVVFYHHALKLLPEGVRRYIEGKVFLDCGASYGDSAAVLGKYYSPKKVISYELTNTPNEASEAYSKTLRDNNLDQQMFELITKGVSDQCINLDGGYQFVTIDSDQLFRDDIGLIKMDIEGAAFDAIKGATEVIKRNRPVLVISIYHTPTEFFEIKPYLELLRLDYNFLIRNLNFVTNYELETVLVAFPKHLG